ncbi:jg19100 [Pararge aegeria aegeria]|uniref:Jg19100 protein n=1 Tax=Pararge aegeria aegeria TaxID=348720 RepID=A0A8S4SA53_9NEOP|nr:jg19100 [Pararge aegeria aegeria]
MRVEAFVILCCALQYVSSDIIDEEFHNIFKNENKYETKNVSTSDKFDVDKNTGQRVEKMTLYKEYEDKTDSSNDAEDGDIKIIKFIIKNEHGHKRIFEEDTIIKNLQKSTESTESNASTGDSSTTGSSENISSSRLLESSSAATASAVAANIVSTGVPQNEPSVIIINEDISNLDNTDYIPAYESDSSAVATASSAANLNANDFDNGLRNGGVAASAGSAASTSAGNGVSGFGPGNQRAVASANSAAQSSANDFGNGLRNGGAAASAGSAASTGAGNGLTGYGLGNQGAGQLNAGSGFLGQANGGSAASAGSAASTSAGNGVSGFGPGNQRAVASATSVAQSNDYDHGVLPAYESLSSSKTSSATSASNAYNYRHFYGPQRKQHIVFETNFMPGYSALSDTGYERSEYGSSIPAASGTTTYADNGVPGFNRGNQGAEASSTSLAVINGDSTRQEYSDGNIGSETSTSAVSTAASYGPVNKGSADSDLEYYGLNNNLQQNVILSTSETRTAAVTPDAVTLNYNTPSTSLNGYGPQVITPYGYQRPQSFITVTKEGDSGSAASLSSSAPVFIASDQGRKRVRQTCRLRRSQYAVRIGRKGQPCMTC